MGIKLPSDQLALYKRIDQILYKDWDPIGVSDFDGPIDEYQGYLPQVFKLALSSNDPVEIAKYLTSVTVERMGMKPCNDFDLEIAKKILASKEELLDD